MTIKNKTTDKPLVCPACDGTLEQGYIIGSGEITWSRKIRHIIGPTFRHKEDKVIAPFRFLDLPRQTAHCCESCGLVITFSTKVS